MGVLTLTWRLEDVVERVGTGLGDGGGRREAAEVVDGLRSHVRTSVSGRRKAVKAAAG